MDLSTKKLNIIRQVIQTQNETLLDAVENLLTTGMSRQTPTAEGEEEVFKLVEEMPRFPGCEETEGAVAEKKQCADRKMLEFIYEHIEYPAAAREDKVEGTVVIAFVVEKDGEVTGARVVRDIGGQCGAEALRVVNLMREKGLRWTPGKQLGLPVRVQFMLPVRFKLE